MQLISLKIFEKFIKGISDSFSMIAMNIQCYKTKSIVFVLMRVRPQTAFARSKKTARINAQTTDKNHIDFNESKQVIFHPETKEEQINQHKSENAHKKDSKFSKSQFVALLMKLQLQKMGFSPADYESVLLNFLVKSQFEQVELKHVKQWVLSQKSKLVDQVISNIQQKQNKQVNEQIQSNLRQKSDERSVKMNQQILQERAYAIDLNGDDLQVIQPSILRVQPVQKQQKRPIQIPSIVCPICLMETTQYFLRDCDHIFCKECIRGYVQQNISNGNYIIDCPQFECTAKILQDQVQAVLSHHKYERYIKFKHKVELQTNPNNKFCTKPDCGCLLGQNGQNALFCFRCKIAFCQMCQQQEHPGQNCNQSIQQNMNETYNSFNIKKCPHCSSPIQKVDGCNHITCKKCKAEFCWICLKTYTPYHYRIYNCWGCPGLQFEQAEDICYKRVIQVLFFVLLPLLLALGIAAIFLLLPFYMLFTLFSKPCSWLQDNQKCQLMVLNNICCCLPECLLIMLGYFVLWPRAILYTAFISPIKYFIMVGSFICTAL